MFHGRFLGALLIAILLPAHPVDSAGSPPADPGADPSVRRDFGRLNPKAPPETAQFAFMIGAGSGCAAGSPREPSSGRPSRPPRKAIPWS
jgi:hypothetical protein